MLEEVKVIDKIEILENGVVQVREVTRILKDGQVIAETFHRTVIEPGQDIETKDKRVQDVCALVQTTDVIKAHKDTQKKV